MNDKLRTRDSKFRKVVFSGDRNGATCSISMRVAINLVVWGRTAT